MAAVESEYFYAFYCSVCVLKLLYAADLIEYTDEVDALERVSDTFSLLVVKTKKHANF